MQGKFFLEAISTGLTNSIAKSKIAKQKLVWYKIFKYSIKKCMTLDKSPYSKYD